MVRAQKKSSGKKHCGSKGIVHVNCTFNTTTVTVSEENGDVVSWSSTGKNGFKGSKKSTAHAAGITAKDACQNAYSKGMREVEIRIKGAGPGREMAMKSVALADLKVLLIQDVTPNAHNGGRPPKERRV